MDIIYRRGKASVSEVLGDLPDPPSYSAVRALMRILEEKGHLKHGKSGPRYVYQPTWSRRSASRSALQRVVETFFDGSVENTVTALLDVSDVKLSEDELKRLEKMILDAKAR
jgi:predicted transcriptional regulator